MTKISHLKANRLMREVIARNPATQRESGVEGWAVFRFDPIARGWRARGAGPVLFHLNQQVLVDLEFLEGGDERFHGLDWIQVDHGAAHLTNRFQGVGREKFFLLAGAAERGVCSLGA